MDERRGDLDPLAHPLRVPADRAIRRIGRARPASIARAAAPARVRQPVEAGGVLDEPAPGEVGGEALALGDEAHAAVDGRVAPGGAALRPRRSRWTARAGPAIIESSVLFPAPVGAQEAGDAGAERER